ncbi:hypothetical protein ANCCAN_17614 [Ancylostoma caninum]|uniref:Uncharacterized protein n=1 Tax=Ancylostoma caninum TaxID=29170 RepID=A0A368FWD0_ANCCA|nr:hypothetical protein ANCCAN_17614 [Ancylostoma caninum]
MYEFLTDCAMVDLAEFFFDEKPEQFLATLYNVIAEAIVADSSHSFAKESNEPATSPPKKPRRSPDLRQVWWHFWKRLLFVFLRS